jgi:hypothetical protein
MNLREDALPKTSEPSFEPERLPSPSFQGKLFFQTSFQTRLRNSYILYDVWLSSLISGPEFP